MLEIYIDNQLLLNIMVHVCILFIFLYFFFFLVISKKGENVLNENINSLCDNNVNDILKEIDEKYGDKIKWNELRQKCVDVRDHPVEQINNHIEETNNYYKHIGIYIAISLILITIIFYFYNKDDIDIGEILKENALTFLLIGLIEYIFFMYTASKYVPAYPTTIGTIILDRSKKNIRYF